MERKEENKESVLKDISDQQNQQQWSTQNLDQAAKFRQYQQETEDLLQDEDLDDMDDELGFNNFGKFENQQELERQFKEYHRQMMQERENTMNLFLRDSTRTTNNKKKREVVQYQSHDKENAQDDGGQQQVNLQDVFNKLKIQGAKYKKEDKMKKEMIKELSPKSKRLATWDLEDSCSDEEDDCSDDPSFPETCICLICDEEFDDAESAKVHLDRTRHESLEMICSKKDFVEQFDYSLQMKKQEKEDWLDQLKQEFATIFELHVKDDLFVKVFSIYQGKIINSMVDEGKSLYANKPLKIEIFEFIMAQQRKFKCSCCFAKPFETKEELLAHISESQNKKPSKKNKKKGIVQQKCSLNEAQKYLLNMYS